MDPTKIEVRLTRSPQDHQHRIELCYPRSRGRQDTVDLLAVGTIATGKLLDRTNDSGCCARAMGKRTTEPGVVAAAARVRVQQVQVAKPMRGAGFSTGSSRCFFFS